MPWKEQSQVDQRYEFIVHLREGRSMTEACRVAGIDRKTGYKWQARYEAEGVEGLRDRSKVAHHRPHALDEEVVEHLLALRRAHPAWGPKKLIAQLEPLHPELRFPARSTVSELLRREGLSQPRKKRERVAAYESPFAGYHGPNAVWCMDFKGAMKLRNAISEPFTVSDGTTRFLLRCDHLKLKRTKPVKCRLSRAFCEYGLPDAIRSDNGPPFATVGLAGLGELSVWLIKLEIVPERIQPGCPSQNGRHERIHRTMEEELGDRLCKTKWPQRELDRFRYDYNHHRPHEALNFQTPAQVYRPSPNCFPTKLRDPAYSKGYVLERLGERGQLPWRGKSFYLSKALAGELVGIDIDSGEFPKLFFGPILLGVIKSQRFYPRDKRKTTKDKSDS